MLLRTSNAYKIIHKKILTKSCLNERSIIYSIFKIDSNFLLWSKLVAGSLNKVQLIGNLGRDPEIRSTQDGKEIANLTIATSESWKDKVTGERKEKTEWHRIVIFNDGLVNVVKNYVKKGSKLYIEGALQTRKWTDQSGVEKYTTEIVLQGFGGTLVMLDNKSGGSDSNVQSLPAQGNAGSNESSFVDNDLDDAIPF